MAILTRTPSELAPAPFFPVTPLEFPNRHGLLVRSPNWLGDAVMILPALRVLHQVTSKAGVQLAVLAPAGLNDLFSCCSDVDNVICLTRQHAAFDPTAKSTIRKFYPDAALLFNNSLRDTLSLRQLGVKNLYGAAARCRSLFLKRAFRFPKRRNCILNEMHHANKYLAMAYALGAPQWDGRFSDWHFPETPSVLHEDNRRLLVLAAGAAYGAAKRWSAGEFHEVAETWIASGGRVAALGSAAERKINEEVIADFAPADAVNLSGETNFFQLAEILRRATFCVANDSGIMHLAAALGTPGIAIFGPTDYAATGPISSQWSVIYNKIDCSPCFKRECPKKDPVCMKVVHASDVIAAMRQRNLF